MQKEIRKISEESFKTWKKKRSSTFYIYCLMYLINGMHTAFMNATIWIYVTTQILTNKSY